MKDAVESDNVDADGFAAAVKEVRAHFFSMKEKIAGKSDVDTFC